MKELYSLLQRRLAAGQVVVTGELALFAPAEVLRVDELRVELISFRAQIVDALLLLHAIREENESVRQYEHDEDHDDPDARSHLHCRTSGEVVVSTAAEPFGR